MVTTNLFSNRVHIFRLDDTLENQVENRKKSWTVLKRGWVPNHIGAILVTWFLTKYHKNVQIAIFIAWGPSVVRKTNRSKNRIMTPYFEHATTFGIIKTPYFQNKVDQ